MLSLHWKCWQTTIYVPMLSHCLSLTLSLTLSIFTAAYLLILLISGACTRIDKQSVQQVYIALLSFILSFSLRHLFTLTVGTHIMDNLTYG